ncbi:hypothetical protein LTR12_018081 [Friedmanniomyces endolithicus]|nr:hypothetical protein LTR12_018081 [Friedmanniomyces endolithicus]
MTPIVVSTTNARTPALGGLFNGVAFFLLQRLPSRSTYVDKVQANGGRVVKLEAQATYIIADHLRVGCPPGSISYTFIDSANKDGALPNPDDHPAGPLPGAIREVGSVSAPGKQTRTAFTAEDDWVLWQWVERARSEGGMVKGNDIYKQLEAKDPRHTFQAAGTTAPPSAPREPDEEEGQVLRADFTQDELDHLMSEAANIRAAGEDMVEAAWQAFAGAFPSHSAQEWKVVLGGDRVSQVPVDAGICRAAGEGEARGGAGGA